MKTDCFGKGGLLTCLKKVFAGVLLSGIAGIWTADAEVTKGSIDSARNGPKPQFQHFYLDPKAPTTGGAFDIRLGFINTGDLPAEGGCVVEILRNNVIVASRTAYADVYPPSVSPVTLTFTLTQSGSYIARATWKGRRDYNANLTITKQLEFTCNGGSTLPEAQNDSLRQQQEAAARAVQEAQRQQQAEQVRQEQQRQQQALAEQQRQQEMQQNERTRRAVQESDLQFRLALANRDAQVVQQVQREKAEQARRERFRQEQQAVQQEQAAGAVADLINIFQSAAEQGAQARAEREQAKREQSAQEQVARENAALDDEMRRSIRESERQIALLKKAAALSEEVERKHPGGLTLRSPEEVLRLAEQDRIEEERATREKNTQPDKLCPSSVISLKISAPSECTIGEEFASEITVTALEDAAKIEINYRTVKNAVYIRSEPPAEIIKEDSCYLQVVWKLEAMAAGEARLLRIWLKPIRADVSLTPCVFGKAERKR